MRSRVILACIVAASGAGAPTQPPAETVLMEQDAGTLGIASGYYREVCHTLKRGDKRRYSFTTSVPLDFNIHYHAEDAVIDLALGHNVRSKEGVMAAGVDGEEIYCWMWVNLQVRRAELTFRIWKDAP